MFIVRISGVYNLLFTYCNKTNQLINLIFNSHYKLYGITQDPSNSQYLLVLTYAYHGDLRNYIRNNYINITWTQRIRILHQFCNNLQYIHSKDIVHADIHTGNLLQLENNNTK